MAVEHPVGRRMGNAGVHCAVQGTVMRAVELGMANGLNRHRVVDLVGWRDWTRTLVSAVEVRWAHWDHLVEVVGRRGTSRSYAMQG